MRQTVAYSYPSLLSPAITAGCPRPASGCATWRAQQERVGRNSSTPESVVAKRAKLRPPRSNRKLPRPEDTAAVVLTAGKAFFVTNDMLIKQIQRDGPTIARSFDVLIKDDMIECSKIFARCSARILNHLPVTGENEFKETAARLLFSALSAYAASIEVARHGYPRQYGASARSVIETIAVVLEIATVPESLARFHKGDLTSTKTMAAAKKCLPLLGPFYGMLSNDFVHIGPTHATLEGPTRYKEGNQALSFVATMMRALIVLIDLVADLIFGTDAGQPIYWKAEGFGWRFDPGQETMAYLEKVLQMEPPR